MFNGNWRSIDAATAMKGVRSEMSKEELLEIAYNARCGGARRLAIIFLNNLRLTKAFALEDPDPLVRRGLARRLTNLGALNSLLNDCEASVRKAATDTILKLKSEI